MMNKPSIRFCVTQYNFFADVEPMQVLRRKLKFTQRRVKQTGKKKETRRTLRLRWLAMARMGQCYGPWVYMAIGLAPHASARARARHGPQLLGRARHVVPVGRASTGLVPGIRPSTGLQADFRAVPARPARQKYRVVPAHSPQFYKHTSKFSSNFSFQIWNQISQKT